jgi:hypothetical protein
MNTVVENVILSCNPNGGAYNDVTDEYADLTIDREGTYHGCWSLRCNDGRGPRSVAPGSVGWLVQDGRVAGFIVFDGDIRETGMGGGTVDGYSLLTDW